MVRFENVRAERNLAAQVEHGHANGMGEHERAWAGSGKLRRAARAHVHVIVSGSARLRLPGPGPGWLIPDLCLLGEPGLTPCTWASLAHPVTSPHIPAHPPGACSMLKFRKARNALVVHGVLYHLRQHTSCRILCHVCHIPCRILPSPHRTCKRIAAATSQPG